MKHGHVIVALAWLGACAGAKVDVRTLATAPRPLSPVTPQQLRTFETRPEGAIAVYDIDAYGDTKPALEAAVHDKAASLGCDGIMLLVHKETGGNADPDATTGQLNEHHTRPGSHYDALCIVLPASAAGPADKAAPAGG